MSKRQESLSGFSGTMDELSVLLKAQSGNNDKVSCDWSRAGHVTSVLTTHL